MSITKLYTKHEAFYEQYNNWYRHFDLVSDKYLIGKFILDSGYL